MLSMWRILIGEYEPLAKYLEKVIGKANNPKMRHVLVIDPITISVSKNLCN